MSEQQQQQLPVQDTTQPAEATVEETKQSEEPQQVNASDVTQDDSTTTASTTQQQQPKKSKYLKRNFQYCKNYDDINAIVKAFPSLNSLLTPPDLENTPNALCYVIRSNNDDDVHKAIKYGIWTSVPGNNVKLSAAWETAQQLGVEVYLFFSVVKSGQFNGVARLKSSFQDETFSYWWQPHKFKGHFKIEWVFVKDVKQKQFEGLKNIQGDDISRSKDCTELNYESTGKKMLQIFSEAPAKPSIFNFFKFFDTHEQQLRRHYTYIGSQNAGNNPKQAPVMYAGNPHIANAIPNQNGFFFPQAQFQYPPFYQKKMYNQQQQFMQQMGMIQQQMTPEQFSSMQNLCETHIYPPNTTFQQQSQQQQQQQQQQQHNHHHHHKNGNNHPNSANQPNRRNNNNHQHGNGRKPHHNKGEKSQPQQQLPTQDEMPKLESLKSPVQEQ